MCNTDVEAEFIIGHSRQETERAVQVIFQMAKKEMCLHVFLQQYLLTTDLTGQHGWTLQTKTQLLSFF